MRSLIQIALFMLLIIGCNLNNGNRSSDESDQIISLNKIKLKDLSGQPINMSSFNGKTVFVNFWATWCRPCVEEIPSLQTAAEQLKDDDIVFLFASEESAEEIEQFKNSHGYKMDFVQVESLDDLEILGLPTTFIFDTKGKLIFSELGARNWSSDESIALIRKYNE